MTIVHDQATWPRRVRVSAPAKVLLFGEHAVVYGCPSVAAALTDMRLAMFIDRVQEQDAAVELVFEDILENDPHSNASVPLRRRFGFASLRAVVDGHTRDDAFLPTPSTVILQRVDDLVRHDDVEIAKALRPAIFLCCALLHSSPLLTSNDLGSSLHIRASAGNFPIGAGLGSSAAFSVALAGALSHFQAPGSSVSVDRINKFAFSSEVILHGSPSGVDNTVSAFGGTLLFCKLPTPHYERIACDLSQFRFLIVNTRVPRSTKEQVANVRRRYDANMAVTQAQFDAIRAIITRFTDLSARGDLTETVVGTLMTQNHTILNDLGVGHARIEDVVKSGLIRGCWTKLTGAGGGGCTISLIPSQLNEQELVAMLKELEDQDFQCFVSAVGGAGFTVDSVSSD